MKTLASLATVSLKNPEINLLNKIDSYKVIIPTETEEPRSNPYSGKTVTLSPLLASLYDFIISSYNRGLVGPVIPVSVWDRARYLFNRLNPDAYYDLID